MICFFGGGAPAFVLPLALFLPPSPRPALVERSSRREGGDLRLFYARGFAPCIPGAEPGRHRFALPLWKTQCGLAPAGTCSPCPGPPSPWLPALLIGKPFCRFCVEPQAFRCAGYLFGRLCKCRKRFNARGAGGGAPGEINFGSPPSPWGKGVGGMGADK